MESRAEDGRANFHDSRGQKNAENDVAHIRENIAVRLKVEKNHLVRAIEELRLGI